MAEESRTSFGRLLTRVPARPFYIQGKQQQCQEDFTVLSESNSTALRVVPLLIDSSTAINLEAVKLLQVFHGGDTGNFDQCSGMIPGFHHCLAGSTDRNWTPGVIISPFAGMCVPDTCGPAELQNSDLDAHIEALLKSKSGWKLSKMGRKQVDNYLSTIKQTLAAADYLQTGITCGSHAFPATYRVAGSSDWNIAVALYLFLIAAIISVVVRAYGPRWCSKRGKRQQYTVLVDPSIDPHAEARKDSQSYGSVEHEHKYSPSSDGINSDHIVGSGLLDGTLPVQDNGDTDKDQMSLPTGNDDSFAYGGVFLRAFDFGVNFKRLFTVDDSKRGAFRALDGLRVLSILWVILGHALAQLNAVGFSNPTNVLPPYGLTHEVGAQLFFSARLAVDTFLWLSGFLVTLGMLRRLGLPAHDKALASSMPVWYQWVPAFHLNRVLRILPLYAACLGFWWKIAPSLNSGPFWFAWNGYVDKCERLWWTNFLFVNNLIPTDGSETDGCYYWAWYLALDMQFSFVLAPITLLLYLKNRLTAEVFVIGCLILSVVGGYWYSMETGISANSFDGIWVSEYSRKFYTKPWFRAPPYLVGIYTAMLWKNSEGTDRKMRGMWVCLTDFFPINAERNRSGSSSSGNVFSFSTAWLTIIVALLVWITFGPVGAYQHLPCSYDVRALEIYYEPLDCGSHWTLQERALFNALAPLAWSCGVSLLCLLCFRGRGGWIGQLLGHPIWVPFARLSYGAYLIHPIVLNFMVLSRATKIRLDVVFFVSFYVAAVTLTFCTTTVAVLLVESPIACLTKALFDKRSNDSALNGLSGRGRARKLLVSRSLPSTASIELSSPMYLNRITEKEGLL